MKQKHKLILIMMLSVLLLLSTMNYNSYNESIIQVDNVVKGSKAKRAINSTPTLKVKLLGESSNLIYKIEDKNKGIYELARTSMNESIKLNTEVIEADSNESADLFFGPAAIFDKGYFLVSKPLYTKQYILYTTDFDKNTLEDFKNEEIANCGFKISGYNLETNISDEVKEEAFSQYNLVDYKNEEIAVNNLLSGYPFGLISDQEIVSLEINSNIKKIVMDKVLIDFVVAFRIREFETEVSDAIINFSEKFTEHENYYSLVTNKTYEYYRESFIQTISENEKDWIIKNRNISYTAPNDYAPYSVLNGDELTGITSKVMESLSKVTGINFSFQETDTGSMHKIGLIDQLVSGKVKVVPFIGKSNPKGMGVVFTKPIYIADVVVIGNHKGLYINTIQDLENKTIVVMKDNFIVDEVEKETTNVKIIYAKSNKEVFEMLNKYPDYLSIMDLLVLNNYLKNNSTQDIKVVGKINEQEYYIAVDSQSETLVNILNRAIMLIDVERFAYNYTVASSNQLILTKWIIPFFVLLCLIALTMLYLQKVLKDLRLSKEVKEDIQKMNVEYDHIIGQVLEIFETASLVTQSNTHSHSKRLTTYCEVLALEYGLGEEYAWEISHYVPIHDIGNIGVNNDLFMKEEELTGAELEQLKMHVKIGSDLVIKMRFDDVAKNIVEYHHERWDGLGYFQGLKGTEIPIEARIVHLADTYDILRMERPYKRAYTHQEAVFEILDERGKQFEPRLVDIFLKYNSIFENCYDTSIELIKKLK